MKITTLSIKTQTRKPHQNKFTESTEIIYSLAGDVNDFRRDEFLARHFKKFNSIWDTLEKLRREKD